MELGPQKIWKKIYETYFFCVVECGTRSLSKGVLWYLLKVVLEAKNGPQKNMLFFKKNMLVIIIYFIMRFYFKLKYDQYFTFWATSMHFVACS